MLVGFGVTGGSVGEGTKGFADDGVASGECLGEGNSVARLLFTLAGRLSFAFSFSSLDGEGEAFVFAFTFTFVFVFAFDVGFTAPPNGIPCSFCPVGGDAGWTA